MLRQPIKSCMTTPHPIKNNSNASNQKRVGAAPPRHPTALMSQALSRHELHKMLLSRYALDPVLQISLVLIDIYIYSNSFETFFYHCVDMWATWHLLQTWFEGQGLDVKKSCGQTITFLLLKQNNLEWKQYDKRSGWDFYFPNAFWNTADYTQRYQIKAVLFSTFKFFVGGYFATNPKMVLTNVDQWIIGNVVLAVGSLLEKFNHSIVYHQNVSNLVEAHLKTTSLISYKIDCSCVICFVSWSYLTI